MDITMCSSLYPTPRAATRAAVSEYLYANGLNDDAYVLDTLRMAGHGVLADEVAEWMESAPFEPERDDILEALRDMQAMLELAS